MIRKGRNQREILTPKDRGGKTKLIMVLRKHIVSRVYSYFPIGGHSVTQTKIK